MKLTTIALSGLLVLSACTQPGAPVEYRGSQYYGRDGGAIDSPNHETYPPDSPRYKDGYTRPVEPAPAPVVAVADLAPITQNTNSNSYAPAPPSGQPAQPFAAKPSAPIAAAPQGDQKFIWPVAGGRVISHFGLKPDGKSNDGINIAVAEGEPVYAAAGGMVVYAGNELKGYGNMVILRHDNGWMTAYAHTSSIAVKKNDYVKQGDVIAYVGVTGGVKTPQLHFALRQDRTPVDPEKYLPKN